MSSREDDKNTGRRKDRNSVKLEWKDYVAISIAALQTVLLPIVLLLFAVAVVSVLLRVLVFR